MSLMKNLYITLSAAALILAAASCVKDTNTETVLDNARRYVLSFAPFTKTEISGTVTSRSVSWSEGDVVRYYTESNQSSPAEATVSLSGDKAYVSIPRGRTDEFINAVYGATQLKSSSSTDNCMYVTSPVKSDQRYTTFAEAHVCAAFSSDLEDPNLRFHNAVCIIHFTSVADVHKVVFSGNNGEIINGGSTGDLKITHSVGAITVESAASGSNATNQTTVTIATNGEEAEFFFAILPVCFDSGIAVQCYDSYGALMFTKKTGSILNTVTSSGAVKKLNLGKAQDWIDTAPPEPVDLGLSVKWANYNVGASKPEDYGDYFAWGETSPKTEYKWANYLYGTAKNGPFSKYVLNSDYGTVDYKLVLDLEDDAAHANWGGDWRMPTKEEVDELMTQCTWAWTTRNGINGYTVTGNGNSIFLPANGMRSTSLADEGTVGNYWSSSLSGDGTYYSISPYFSQSYKKSGNCYRYFGLGVRPVFGAVVPVSEITMPETFILTMGKTESATLTATVLPDNATYKNLTWVSSDESVAIVDANGTVTAVALGTSTINVYTADGLTSAQCTAYVNQPIESISLDKESLDIYVGDEPIALVATVLPNEFTRKDYTWTSAYPSVAAVDIDGKVTAVSRGSTTITVTANDGSNVSATCMVTVKMRSNTNGRAFVDLGLPSGLKWASCNVGANSPEDYGDYFAWGETEPKEDYVYSTYKWCKVGTTKFTKYCTKSDFWANDVPMDNKTVLDSEDDAASANWGGSWRIPTDEEWTELMTNCSCTWTNDYNGTGIAGLKMTSKKAGYKDKAIFLPAAGHRSPGSLESMSGGCYWSSSLRTDFPDYAWRFCFGSGYKDFGMGNTSRRYGHTVRPVTE